MGSRSSSKSSNTTKNFNIVNNNTGSQSGGGSGNALADNLNAVESEISIGDITTTDQGAVDAGKELGITALAVGSENTRRAYDDVSEAREWAGVLAGDVVDQFQRTTETALQRNSENVKQAFSYASDSDRSEGGLTLEAMAPYGLAALVLVVIVFVATRGRK